MGRHPQRLILPRSRNRPLASTEGSLTKNLNKIGVRLWTYRSKATTVLNDWKTYGDFACLVWMGLLH